MSWPIDVLSQIASAFDRNDEAPNLALAVEIAHARDQKAIQSLVANLSHPTKAIQNDCIKVLYEIGNVAPHLISPNIDDFLGLLTHPNNRLQWGAMTALKSITPITPDKIFNQLPQILPAADKGSVITRDQVIEILVHLASISRYSKEALSLLLEQLWQCPINQFPKYPESSLPVIPNESYQTFRKILASRLKEAPTPAKQKRIEKVLGLISK